MRSGADYRESIRDGRNVWVLGEGPVQDVTTHPATAAMVDFYTAWYDRHMDPEWQDALLTPSDGAEPRRPVAFEIPKTGADLRCLRDAVYSVAFLNAGNVTHTPGYGALIALGAFDAVKGMGAAPERVARAQAYRDDLAATGRFLTFSGGVVPLSDRFHGPEERAGVRKVRENDAGIFVSGVLGMHTSVPFAEEVFVLGLPPDPNQQAWFVLDLSAPGTKIVCRRVAARDKSLFLSPLSGRYDELDAQVWLDEAFVPWERVFALGSDLEAANPAEYWDRVVGWLVWHQLTGWLARADFTLGVALALADVIGLKSNPRISDQLIDLVIDAQTIRSCITAAELEHEVTPAGHVWPRGVHLASASIYAIRARQRMSEILRDMPGSALVVAPTDRDFDDPEIAAGLERAFGGGDYTAKERAALLQLAWDHVSSGLDGRESTFELHANGGLPTWRNRIQRWFDRYNELGNGVLEVLNVELKPVSVDYLRRVGRPVASAPKTPAPDEAKAPAAKSAG